MALPETTADAGFRYRAFISYSHRDKTWGDWLHKALETYRVPSRLVGLHTETGTVPRRLHPVFRDREELASATDLGRKVNEALAQSASMVVICSPAAAASHWVNAEVLAYKAMGRADRIFCLIVDGEPGATDMPGRESGECFCQALRFAVDGNGQLTRDRTEPIAADAREGRDGKANAKLKLIAGLLGVGFDTLKQRDQHRRVRRMVVVTSMAVVVMAITITLAGFALVSRHDAVIAKEQAMTAEHTAERRQKQAEGLVGFMLGDLSDKLNQVHRLDIMQSVDDRAMAYFASLPTTDVTNDSLAQRIDALTKIGTVRMGRGHIADARKAYQAASTLARGLAQRSPRNPDYQATYAESLKWIGETYWYQGDPAHALSQWQVASGLLATAHAAKPDDIAITSKLASAVTDLGYGLLRHGDFSGSEARYELALKLYEDLWAKQPGHLAWLKHIGYTHNSLGGLALEHGQLGRALTEYRADQRIKARLAANAPGDHSAQQALLVSNAILGLALGLYGDTRGAAHQLGLAVTSARALVAFDPTDAAWHEYLARYSRELGGFQRQLGQVESAAQADAEATRVMVMLARKDPTNTNWQQQLAQAKLETARLDLVRNRPLSAAHLVQAALAVVDRLQSRKSHGRDVQLLASHARIVAGEVAARRGKARSAGEYWHQARDVLGPAASSGSDPQFLSAWATATLLLDQTDTARPAVRRLAGMGYDDPDFAALVARHHITYAASKFSSRRVAGHPS